MAKIMLQPVVAKAQRTEWKSLVAVKKWAEELGFKNWQEDGNLFVDAVGEGGLIRYWVDKKKNSKKA